MNQLVTDDKAWATLPPRQIQKVLIVSPGNLFLQKVFEANPLVRIEVTKEMPSQWPTDAIVVLHGHVSPQLPPANLLVIDPIESCDLWDVGTVLENPIVTEQDKASPLMTHIRLDNILMPEAKQLSFNVPAHVLAGTVTGDPVYAELNRSGGKCLVLSVNLERSDLAFRTAFPIMVTNSLGWFAGQNGELRESTPTGTVSKVDFEVTPDIQTDSLTLLSPTSQESRFIAKHVAAPSKPSSDSSSEPISTNESGKTLTGRIGPLNEVGIWSIQPSMEGDAKDRSATELGSLIDIAVNLSNTRETDLRPAKAILDLVKNQANVSGWLARPLWFYLVAVACVLAAFEWFLYQRRVIT
jgi:hypothetical protein